jgi:cytochrome b6-f complex iron-sulfur subunit
MVVGVALEPPVRGALIIVDEPKPPTTPPQPSEAEPHGGGDAPHAIERRKFLSTAWKVLGVGLVVEAAWTSYDILNPKASGAFGGVIDAGSTSDYKEGVVKYFLDGRFYVTSSKGEVVALYQKCPHLGCRVPFCDSSGRFECPCHGSKYNLRGEYIEGPAPRGMDRFPIKVDGDHVLVDTGSVVEGPPRGIHTVSDVPHGPSCVGEGTGSSGGTGGNTGDMGGMGGMGSTP